MAERSGRKEAASDAFQAALVSVWRQVMEEGKRVVELEGQSAPVTFTRAQKLRQVRFRADDRWLLGIEQNPKTASRWAQLARQGKRVMQFIEEQPRRYVAVVADGRLIFYQKLPRM